MLSSMQESVVNPFFPHQGFMEHSTKEAKLWKYQLRMEKFYVENCSANIHRMHSSQVKN